MGCLQNKNVHNLKLIIMKNILYVISFLSICINCKAQQQILSMNTVGMHIENVYYKDLDNELDPYIGTWKGTFDNKTFIITFSKLKLHNTIGNYDQDRLMGKYKMLDSNNAELYSTYNLADDKAKVISLGFVEQTSKTKLRLLFSDLCIEGEIHLNFTSLKKTQMHWKYFTKQTLITDEAGCAVDNEMPRGEMTLIKQ